MKIKSLTLAVVVIAGTASARADDYEAPALWTGAYAGLHAGYGQGGVDVVDTDGGVPYGAFSYEPKGGFGGITLGYNQQFNWLVVGVEVDLGYMDVKGDKVIASSDPAHHQDLTLEGGLYGDFTGRIGIALGRTLFYGKGGVAMYNGEAMQDTTKVWYEPTGTEPFKGFVYGGGIEHSFGGGWSIKAEYLHFDFGSQGGVQEKVISTAPGADDGTPLGYKFHNEHTLEVDTIKGGLNYKF
jgi:outer membrane immunogenic protein